MLFSDLPRAPPHRFPDLQCGGIHIKQTHVGAIVATPAVDADRRQKPDQAALQKIRSHAYRRRIDRILDFVHILGDDRVIGMVRTKLEWKITEDVARVVNVFCLLQLHGEFAFRSSIADRSLRLGTPMKRAGNMHSKHEGTSALQERDRASSTGQRLIVLGETLVLSKEADA